MSFLRWLGVGRMSASGGQAKPANAGNQTTRQRVKTAIAGTRIPETKSIAKLVEEIEKDYQFLLGKLAIKAIVQSAQVSIEGADPADKRATMVADNLMQRWAEALPKAFEAFGFGRVAFEQCYQPVTGDGMTPAYLLDEFVQLPFERTALNVGDSGAIEGVTFTPPKGDPFDLAPPEVWWCAIDATPQEPHGRSRYLGAPREVWRQRRELDDNEKRWLKKYALGHGVLKAPSEYPPLSRAGIGTPGEINQDGQPADPMEDGKKALEALRSGDVAVFPSGNNVDGSPMWEYAPPPGGPATQPLADRRRVLDAAALRSLGVPERALTQDESTGSYSMAQVHWQVMQTTCQGIVDQIAASYQRQVIDRACRYNDVPRMWLIVQRLDLALVALMLELVKTILTAPQPSPYVAEGVVDVARLLESVRLPVGDDLEQRLAMVSAKLAMAAPAGMPGAPAAFGRRFAADPMTPPAAAPDDWESFAERIAADGRTIWQEIAEALADGVKTRRPDWRRL